LERLTGAHYVHEAQLVGFQLIGIGVDHDLAVLSTKRLRHAGAGNTGDLIPHLELGEIA